MAALFLRAGFAFAAALVAAVGFAFLLAAFDYWLASIFTGWVAAAIVGGTLVVMGAILFAVGLPRRRARELAPEDVVFAALGLAARWVRAAPEKALIAAMIAGVVSEWLAKKQRPEQAQSGGELSVK